MASGMPISQPKSTSIGSWLVLMYHPAEGSRLS